MGVHLGASVSLQVEQVGFMVYNLWMAKMRKPGVTFSVFSLSYPFCPFFLFLRVCSCYFEASQKGNVLSFDLLLLIFRDRAAMPFQIYG